MTILAVAIVLCTVLYLVDKNHQWPKFIAIAKWLGKALIGLIALEVAHYYNVPTETILVCAILYVVIWETMAYLTRKTNGNPQ